MVPWNIVVRAFMAMENVMVQRILASSSFHIFVRGIHRRVQEIRHGRDPNEPLKPGEATEPPNKRGFLGLFVEELKHQIRGTESDDKSLKK